MDKIISLTDFQYFKGMKKMFPHSNHPFLNCSHNSLMTIADYFKKDKFSIVNNFTTIYRFDKDKLGSTGYFKLDILNFKRLDQVMDEMCISMNFTSPHIDSLQSEIISSLSKGNPVSLVIDLYYQRGREFYFNKKHGLHPILVYGFNLTTNEVYIVDDITEYKKYVVPFTEIKKACMSEEIKPDEPYFIEFINNVNYHHERDPKEMLHESIKRLKDNMLNHQDEIIEGIQSISLLADFYGDSITNEDIIETLSSTIYRKCSEKFRLVALYEQLNPDLIHTTKEEIDLIINEIIMDWTNIRAITTKAIFSQNINSDTVRKCVQLIRHLHDKEIKFIKQFYNLLNILAI